MGALTMGSIGFSCPPRRLCRAAFVLVALASLLTVVVFHDAILSTTSRVLLYTESLQPADVIVVLRGDEVEFHRSISAASLFGRGLGKVVYVSTALNDEGPQRLRQDGIKLASAQEQIVSVLMQSGVPCDRLLLDGSSPGGGTIGEMKRIRSMMESKNFRSALIVTSWFHTRRTMRIARRILVPDGRIALIAAAGDTVGPDNWWHYRVSAIAVAEEFIKLFLDAAVGAIPFRDNPSSDASNNSSIALYIGCVAAERR